MPWFLSQQLWLLELGQNVPSLQFVTWLKSKNRPVGGSFSEEKRRRDRREFCNRGESETDLLPKGIWLIARLDLYRSP